jgi:transcriptional regulator GlxA family with amidase domain
MQHRVRRTTSVCSGAWLLASAGLLEGRQATTHWSRTSRFRRAFPDVRLEADRIYVQDGPIWTAAGISAGIDLALALIADDLGETVARQVARQLVVYYRRPGGQSQFSELAEMQPWAGVSRPCWTTSASTWTRLDVDALAARACMSPRHFSRRFTEEMGVTPARAVESCGSKRRGGPRERQAVQKVARDCGFGDQERMRRAFLRILGRPPSALRRKPA